MSTDPPFHLQEDGRTALDVAVRKGHEEVARVIRGGGGGGGCFSGVGGVLEVAHVLLHAPYTWMHV
jgi:hypothetical protein